MNFDTPRKKETQSSRPEWKLLIITVDVHISRYFISVDEILQTSISGIISEITKTKKKKKID